MDQYLSIVNDQFTPEILGVIWISNDELNLSLKGFEELNYLFDGLLSQYLYGEESSRNFKNDTNVFFTKNFNNHIFLIYLKSNNQISDVLKKQMALIEKSQNFGRKTILVFNQTSVHLKSELEENFSSFIFKDLDF